MDYAEAQELLKRMLVERVTAQEIQIRAQATIESSELIIKGLLRAYPTLAGEVVDLDSFGEPPEETPSVLRGSRAVLSILQVEENQNKTINELVDALRTQGLLPESDNPANAVRTAVERLVKSGDSNVHKGRDEYGTVVYWFSEPEPEPPKPEPKRKPPTPDYANYDEEPF